MEVSGTVNGRFDAVLYPNYSLSPWQARAVIASVSAVALACGISFAIAGAWPVAGFFGLDVLLLFWGFRIVRNRADRTERVRLEHDSLLIEKDNARGTVRSWRFEPYWVRVHMDEPPERHSLVTLKAKGGDSVRLGADLTPEQRLSFAHALRDALNDWKKTPDF